MHVLLHPLGKCFTRNLLRCDGKNDFLLLVDRCIDLEAIQDQRHFQRRVTDTLVPVDKWMICDKKEAKRRGLLDQGWIQIFAAERLMRLSDRRFKTAAVSQTGRASRLLDHAGVEFDDFFDGEEPHLRQPFVQLGVLRQNSICGTLKFGIASELLFDAGAKQLLNRKAAIMRRSLDLRGDIIRNSYFERLHVFNLDDHLRVRPTACGSAASCRAQTVKPRVADGGTKSAATA